jgi:hypothetical protein
MWKEDESAHNGEFETKYRAAVGGMESSDTDGITDMAYELASEALAEYEKDQEGTEEDQEGTMSEAIEDK